MRALRREVSTLNRRLRRLSGGEELIVRAVRDAYKDPPDLVIPPRPKAGKKRESEIALLHITDTQIGKLTESYSVSVADRRLMELVEKTITITEMRRGAASIDECVLFLGGDMIEGELIFPHQPHEIEQSVFDQAVKTVPAIFTRIILKLLEAFPRVRVACVNGNHGRVAPKGAGSHPRTNWDRVCYEVTRIALLGTEGSPRRELTNRLTFTIPETWYAVEYLYDWGCLLVHGDQMRGGFAGFPWYSVGRKVWGWTDAIPEEWDYLFLGHFHQFCSATLNHRTFFCSGTPESGNVYAQEQLGGSGFPCQRLQFFNARHGVIADHQIFLTEKGERLPQRIRRRGKK